MPANPYGWYITERELKALQWGRDCTTGEGEFFIVGPGFSRYPKMPRSTPCAIVRKLLEKGMVFQDESELTRRLIQRDIPGGELYRLTARAVHVLARSAEGYKVGKQIWREGTHNVTP